LFDAFCEGFSMARILLILLVSGGLGLGLGSLQNSLRPKLDEQFYLPKDGSKASANATAPSGAASAQIATATPSDLKSESTGTPIVEFPNGSKFEFESMKYGTTMSHEFAVRNGGTGPLRIQKAGSTCKCTVPNLEKDVLMPGETTMIKLEWQGKFVSSSFGQSATFKTNAADMAEFNLEIHGAVIDSFVLVPDQINLGSFASDVGTSREFTVFCYAEGVDLDSVEWSSPETSQFVKLTTTPFSPAESEGHSKALKAHKVNVEVLAGMPVGPTSGRVLLNTNKPEIDKLELKVNGTSVSEISLIGGSAFRPDQNVLTIGTLAPGEEFSTKLWLVLRGKDHQAMKVEIDQKGANDSLKVTLGEPNTKDPNRTVIPVNFDVPKGAPDVYYPGTGKSTYVEVVLRATSDRTIQLPVFVKLVIDKKS
jgi:hypothetical protein